MAGKRETAPRMRMVGLCVSLLGYLTMVPSTLAQHGCARFAATETLEIGNNPGDRGNLIELHIRNNLMGEVEILDGGIGSDAIRIEIEKTGPTESIVDSIMSDQVSFDVGKRMIYVVQVDYLEQTSIPAPLVVGSILGVALFLAIMFLLVWRVFKRNQPESQASFSPVNNTQGGQVEPPERSRSTAGHSADREVAGASCRANHNVKCPPPPPPRRTENIYTTNVGPPDGYTLQPNNTSSMSSKGRQAGMGGVGSPRGISKTTVVTMSIVMVISLAYATCVSQPRVRILIFVPMMMDLDSIKLFFNVAHKGLVFTHRWSRRNSTHLSTFDLEDAGLTEKVPCSAEHLCPSAFIQNLAGCDTATGACVCERGYQLNDGLCVDIDECGSGLHACPSAATCQNTIGSYVCRCGYGYYGDQGTCMVCSVGCPAGLYESKPCTNFGDRSCSACSACEGSKYEARPCRGNTDRQCMHVAHPLLITGQESTPSFLEGLKVTSSVNVFSENLHGTRSLQNTHYITDNTRAESTDFQWVRESNLQVLVGISNVQVIPEYEDVPHDSDNRYIVQGPPSEDTSKFKKILRNYCRHPIPEYYSITVEIARDRITTAEQVVCDSNNPRKTKCPKGYNDGDIYLHRSIDEACHKMGTFPEPLEPATNSIVCTKNTALLREIFNQTYTSEKPIKFPSRKCRPAMSRCQQCLNQLRCKMIDIFDQQCCQIDCYTLRDCKMANSAQCTETPVECAMGDAYRYTIQPNFKHFNEFQCHIRYHEPKILYKISYRIKVPGPYGPDSELETQEIHKVVYANDFSYQSYGHYETGFLSVEHNAGITINDEFILSGKNVHAGHEHRRNFTVYSLKESKEYNQRKVVVHEIANNVFVATTQFDQPFAYSTISWVRDNDCDKDVSKFKYQQSHHKNNPQNVYLDINNINNHFIYKLKSKDNPPTIRFHIPGNMSILPFYFRDNGPILLNNGSLRVELELVAGGRIWNIHIQGEMSACPGYLGINIVDLGEEEELFKYENVIFCPVHFNMTFKVPNRGRRAERTFDVRLEDSKKSYHVYLTHLLFESEFLQSEPQTNSQFETEERPWAIIAIVIAVTSVLLLVLNLMYAYFEFTKVRALYHKKNENYYKRSSGEVRDHIGNGASSPSTKLTQKQYMFITAYIAFRVLYSLLFTFTVFLGILGVALQNDVLQLSGIREFQRRKYNESKTLAHEIEKYGQDELLRQAELVTNMQGACSNYIEELFDAMLFQVDNITLNLHHHQMYGQTTSISSLIHQWFKHKSRRYDRTLDNFAERYKQNFTRDVKPALRSYEKYLQKVYKNPWFQFPQLLFNKSVSVIGRPEVFSTVDLHGPTVDFGAFLPIEEVEDVQLWATQWWERYGRLLPHSQIFPAPTVDPSKPACDVIPNMPFLNMSTMARAAKRINSSRFMAPHLPGRSIIGPTLKMSDIREEYKYLIPPETPPEKKDLFSFDQMTESLNLGMLRLVFIVLDVLILIYRSSRTFMVARTLCQGFDETRMISGKDLKLKEKQKKDHEKMEERRLFDGPGDPRQADSAVVDREYTGNAQDYNLPDYMTNIDSHRSMLPPPAPNCSNSTQNGNKVAVHHYAASSSQGSGAIWSKHSTSTSTKETILRLLQSSTVPKIVMGMLILIIFCFIVNCIALVLSVDMMADVDAFRMFLVGLDVQVNRTNWYLTEQAKHFNNITMNIYRGQMTSELLHFQSMVEYFNTEQERLVQNYIDEACAIRKGFLGNRSCDINITPSKLNIPMVPCNFIPIQPRLYTEMSKRFSELHLGHHFEPILSAIRNVFLKCGYAIIVVAATILISHITGVVLFHFLKTRHKFPVHKTFVTSIPDVAIETSHKTTQDIVVAAESEEEEEEEDGDEEEESEMKTYTQTATESPDKMKSLLLKYSETKV